MGDEVLGVDGIKMEGYSLQEAMKLVQEADNILTLEIKFEVHDSVPPNSGTFEVQLEKKTASLSLGITINGSRTRGDTVWISILKKGGIAYRNGMLRSGDVILAINDQSLESCNLHEAAQVLMNTGELVALRIGKEATPPTTTATTTTTTSSPTGGGGGGAISEAIIYSVELHRNQQSLGITLTGSRDHSGHPVVISKIKEDGVAYKTGTLKAGDRILAINGESLYNKTMTEAVCMLNSAGDVVSLKISKATRSKHKPRHKSSSPTGRQRHLREYGAGHHHHHHHHHHHRESFGSSSGSSFVGTGFMGVGGGVGRGPRASNYRTKFNPFVEPVLGESASGYNTPDNGSVVSSIPPSHQPLGHLHYPPSSTATPAHLENHTPSGGAFMRLPAGGLSSSPPHQYQHPHHWQPSQLEDDQMSSVSSRSRKLYYPLSIQTPASLEKKLVQQMLRKQKSASAILDTSRVMASMATKRDSSTDDEMSMYELEARVPKQRRASLPEKSAYSVPQQQLGVPTQQYSPQYLSREAHHVAEGGGGGGGRVWDFRSRHPQRLHIPVGRVSPITPTETERMSAMSHQEMKNMEAVEVSTVNRAD